MGAREVAAVVDAGPLIHLHQDGCLPLIECLGPVCAPEEVWREVTGHGSPSDADLADLGLGREPHTEGLDAFIQAARLARLDRGEQACLHLCHRLGVTLLVTDDLAARDAAKRLSIVPVGSLGVIVRAYRRQRIALGDAERLLLRLRDATSLFVTAAIVELAIEQLRDSTWPSWCLGGHLKTGHSWTGQNRPFPGRPRLPVHAVGSAWQLPESPWL